MANTIKGITIQIEGKTSGLTKSLQEVESQIKKDDAALKNLNKALELDPTNVDLLAAREQVLADKTNLVSQKMDILQQVQQDALNDLPEDAQLSASQMAELEAEIATTGAQLTELTGESDNASDSLEEVGDSADEAGTEAEESSEAMEALGEAAEVAGEVAVAALEAVVVAAAAVGTAVVASATAIGSSMVNATMNTSELADELLTLSSTTGLSTDTLQELNYASELLDVDTQTVTGSMNKLLKTMSSAADGSSSAMEKFTDLGISIYDAEGNLRSTEDVFWDAIDVLGTFESETERDMASMDLFGKSARELNPLIEAGSETFAQLASEAQEVGYVMSGETLDAFGALDDNMVRLSNGAQAVEQSFGAVLLPLLTDMSGDAVDLLGQFSGALASTEGDIDQIGSVIEEFAPQAVAIVEEYFPQVLTIVESVLNALLPAVISIAPQLITMVGSLIQQLASSISQNAESFISAFTVLFQSVVDSAITLLPVLLPLAVDLILTLVDALIENAPMLIDSAISMIDTLMTSLLSPENIEKMVLGATEIITTLLNGLITALPVLIPAALNAILTLVDTLLSGGALGQILEAGLTLITTLSNSLIEYLPVLIGRLPEIILGIVEFLSGEGLPMIIQAGFELLTGIIANLPDIIVAIVGGLIELVAGMFEYITGDGADDILQAFQAAFDGIINGAGGWGADIIDNLISGITSMFSSLTSTVSDAASIIADFLHFSEPEKGPLSDFNESGADMIQNYIESMQSQRTALENALADTAGLIASDFDSDFNVATDSNVHQTVDYTGGLSRIEQAITSQAAAAGADGATIVIPVYLGNELIDTVVVDAVDRYNYSTGGH